MRRRAPQQRSCPPRCPHPRLSQRPLAPRPHALGMRLPWQRRAARAAAAHEGPPRGAHVTAPRTRCMPLPRKAPGAYRKPRPRPAPQPPARPPPCRLRPRRPAGPASRRGLQQAQRLVRRPPRWRVRPLARAQQAPHCASAWTPRTDQGLPGSPPRRRHRPAGCSTRATAPAARPAPEPGPLAGRCRRWLVPQRRAPTAAASPRLH